MKNKDRKRKTRSITLSPQNADLLDSFIAEYDGPAAHAIEHLLEGVLLAWHERYKFKDPVAYGHAKQKLRSISCETRTHAKFVICSEYVYEKVMK
jgi:hypothetical protein